MDILLPFGLHRFVYFDPKATRTVIDTFLMASDTVKTEATVDIKNQSFQDITVIKKVFPNLGLEGGVQGLEIIGVYFGLGKYLSSQSEFALLMRLTKKNTMRITIGMKAKPQKAAEEFMKVLQRLFEKSG